MNIAQLNNQNLIEQISKINSNKPGNKAAFVQFLNASMNLNEKKTVDSQINNLLPMDSEDSNLQNDLTEITDEQLSNLFISQELVGEGFVDLSGNEKEKTLEDIEMSILSSETTSTTLETIFRLLGSSGSPQQTEIMDTVNTVSTPSRVHLDTAQLLSRLSSLSEQANLVLSKLDPEKISRTESLQLMKILEQWHSVDKQLKLNGTTTAAESTTVSKEASKEQTIWNQLVHAFQKRSEFQAPPNYRASSVVTTADITKWLKQAFSTMPEGTSLNVVANGAVDLPTIPMSKVEQYVIHLNQSSNGEARSNELLEQLHKYIQSSKFLNNSDGKQLLLKLRPGNLGEMVVKFVQVDGEMVVKIAVSNQVAKDMLEGNINQLRHMFTPQQVIIEKQEQQVLQQEQYLPEEQMGKGSFEQSSSDNSDSQKEGNEDKSDKENSFHQLLMNEKE